MLFHSRTERGPLAALWVDFLDMVEILLDLIRSFREGDWFLHLHAVRALLPWCFSYDHINYARYASLYYAQMCCLSDTHPEVYGHFLNGGFAVQRSKFNPFAKQPVDQVS